MPDFEFETKAGVFENQTVCGVDEAGRGPLSGPVVAAAVILNPENIPDGLNDSKALSHSSRERLLNILEGCAQIGIGIAEPGEIDRLNILWASMIAMRRAIENLRITVDCALIDGNRVPPELKCDAHAIVKGDAKSLSIAAASIVAKVTRDRLMAEADQRFPGYGWAGHKGYPTKAHREAVERLGRSPVHRWTFGR
ncbi:ribonuclease HII [Litorimonas sp. WD9-15]|uniref:ribonuclease HII n=1 Tax=Litorimonas sp. WD9-15 TaxID=3418716 RepID=UPI003CFC3D30